jgi:hypothetical protein
VILRSGSIESAKEIKMEDIYSAKEENIGTGKEDHHTPCFISFAEFRIDYCIDPNTHDYFLSRPIRRTGFFTVLYFHGFHLSAFLLDLLYAKIIGRPHA